MEEDLYSSVVALAPKVPQPKNQNNILKDDIDLLNNRFEMAKNEDQLGLSQFRRFWKRFTTSQKEMVQLIGLDAAAYQDYQLNIFCFLLFLGICSIPLIVQTSMVDESSRVAYRFDQNYLSYAEYSMRGALRGIIWLLCTCFFLVFVRFEGMHEGLRYLAKSPRPEIQNYSVIVQNIPHSMSDSQLEVFIKRLGGTQII